MAVFVIEHMCALLDVAELAELIASGAIKSHAAEQTHDNKQDAKTPRNLPCNQRYLKGAGG